PRRSSDLRSLTTSARISAASARSSRAWERTLRPSSVSTGLRPRRRAKTSPPTSRSSARICALTEGCAMPNRSAAAAKLPSSTMATKTSIRRSVTFSIGVTYSHPSIKSIVRQPVASGGDLSDSFPRNAGRQRLAASRRSLKAAPVRGEDMQRALPLPGHPLEAARSTKDERMNVVGIDIGGTFTDLVGYVDGAIVTSKTSTVPADPTKGIATSLELAGCRTDRLDEILHGSTIAINTVLEHKGARTALLTTRGF